MGTTTHPAKTCRACGQEYTVLSKHLKTAHPGMSAAQYRALLKKSAPVEAAATTSPEAAPEPATEKEVAPAPEAVAMGPAPSGGVVRPSLHELFRLGKHCKEAMDANGNPIPVTVLIGHGHPELVPEINKGYVFDPEILKDITLGLEFNIPIYCWGHKGTGKTTLLEQVCAYTNRPFFRVQHTPNTEESHIVGQWGVKDGHTVFEYGPLPLAMLNGWAYLADEYDFGLSSVLSVYQAVLEGKPLVIKEAPAHMRVIKPHPNFRFMATGNTNGSGDETGLYQGTNVMNAANYDRFGVVVEMRYMNKRQEIEILHNEAQISKTEAAKIIEFATYVREAFDRNKISDTVSTRALVTAAKLGKVKSNWQAGLQLSFIAKLSRIDREVVNGIAQRVFG